MSAQPVHEAPHQVAKTPAAIRDALLPEERPQFEAAYQAAIHAASVTYDLTPVHDCLDRWWPAARLTVHDPEGHRRMLETARRVNAGEDVTGATWAEMVERYGVPELPS